MIHIILPPNILVYPNFTSLLIFVKFKYNNYHFKVCGYSLSLQNNKNGKKLILNQKKRINSRTLLSN